MEAILVRKANTAPDAVAVVDSDRVVSYRELIARADMVADLLYQQSFEPDTPVCILANTGLHQVMAQVAVLRAGGSCVPVDPAAPEDRLKSILEDLNTKYIITDKDNVNQVQKLSPTLIESVLEAKVDLDTETEITVRMNSPESHRSHIIFTSGSTGRPKPIQVLGNSILHALDNFPFGPLLPSDRMTALITPGFDLSVCEMWLTLLAGATIVRVPDLVRADPPSLQDFAREHKISTMIVPTALFHVVALTAPSTFRGLRHVVVGGEAVSSSALRKVLEAAPPENLWNGYGPAEATMFATVGRLDPEEMRRSHVSIGRPVGDTKVYLLHEDLNPITEAGHTGEICIAGPQLSPGYLNRNEENQKHFISLSATLLGDSSDKPIRVYRTGDLAQWRDKSGVLEFIGRADDQVKISGYRVELGDISCCVEKHPKVHACVVKYIPEESSSGYIEAYVVPSNWDSQDTSDELIDWVKERLPQYMVPSTIYMKRRLPLSHTGKVDKKALQPHNETEQPHHRKEGGHPKNNITKTTRTNDREGNEDITQWLLSTLQGFLPKSEISMNDDMFALGLTSLQAARLVGMIKRDYKESITLAQLHQNPTVEQLTKSMNSSDSNSAQFSLERCVEDSKDLGSDLLPPDWHSNGEGRVFLTGATGFLGAHILHGLLAMPSVQKVACLARGKNSDDASTRVKQTLEKYNLWDGRRETTQKIMVLHGDMGDSTLGLGEKQFRWLINWASVVFHVGARVNWCQPYEAHHVPNVLGTRNVIRAAMLGRRKSLHYVSSIDVWTVTGYINKVDRVYEDESLDPHLNALPYDTGYAASQFVAEQIVRRARAGGLPTAIYRPGFIIGHSKSALANEKDYFSRLIMGSIQCGCYPHLPDQFLDYVTVDYVAEAVLHIASSRDNLGRSYHIVPPDRSLSIGHDQKYTMLRDIGYPVKMVDYREWVERIRDSPGNALESMMPLLDEPVHEGLSRLQTSKNTPVYDPTNTTRALQDRPDIKYVALDTTLLKQFIENWEKRKVFTS
ncbi:nonribosomal peptide synthase [Aspergillus piperis CBS 112811]|uniref:Nonribosomal peptide synthase n=1 Tax=Aspergillus piperis CBS 112811 TaxID=1448313 RepID=A0A8G1VKW7_9EURO|nr:nonribosomal peptide synthase [Aspergillus piperis CBS 112811]RAH57199.1 nonribosomal peptide synthase [Aspergillus piperis CBS 112811]